MSTQKIDLPGNKKHKIKEFLKENQNEIVTILGFIFVGLTCFALGRMTVQNQSNFSELSSTATMAGQSNFVKLQQIQKNQKIQFVSSKSGSKYHWPWCSWAKKIKESHRLYFDSEQEARAAGYSRCGSFEKNAPMGYKEEEYK